MTTTLRAMLPGILLVSGASGLHGQQQPPPSMTPASASVTSADEAPSRRFSFGLGFRWVPASLIEDGSSGSADTKANTSQTVATAGERFRYGLAPAVEMRLTGKFSIRTEFCFQTMGYTKTTSNYKGIDDPATTTDERTLKSTITEHTKARYYEVPVVVRYQGLSKGRILSRAFVEGGAAVRILGKVTTGTSTLNSDSSTAYNEIPVTPASGTIVGGVVGAGLRFMDDLTIKVTPGVRYTFWSGSTFDLDPTRSRTRQLEVGVSFAF
jgi:hypothetical protein